MRIEDLSDSDLEHLASGNVEKLSTPGLEAIAGDGGGGQAKPSGDMRDLVVELAKMLASKSGEKLNLFGPGGSAELPIGFMEGLTRRQTSSEGATAERKLGRIAGKAAPVVAATAALGPAGSMGAAALEGAVAGGTELAAQKLGEATGGEQGNRNDAILNAAVPPLIRGTGSALGAAGRFIGPKLSQAATDLAEYAKAKGIPLSPADISKSKFVSGIESLLEKTPLGGNVIQKFRERQIQAIKTLGEKISSKLGTKADAEEVGGFVQEYVRANSREFYNESVKKYALVGEAAGANSQVPITSLRARAADFLAQEQKLPANLQDRQAIGILKDIGEVLGDKSDFQTLQLVRSRLGDLVADHDSAIKLGMSGQKFISDRSAGLYKQLRGAMDKDLNAWVSESGNEAIKVAKQAADAFYAEGKQRFANRTIRALTAKNPEDLVRYVFQPGNVTEIKQVRAAAGEQGFRQLKELFVERLLSKPGTEEKFLPSALNREIGKYGNETLRQIFKPDELKEIVSFGNLAQAAQSAERIAGNPSGTARQLLAAGAGGLLLHNPVSGAVAILTPPILAKMYLSPVGRKLLTEGLQMSAENARATGTFAKILAYTGLKAVRQ